MVRGYGHGQTSPWALRVGVQGLEFRGLGSRGFGFGVSGLGFRV